MQSVTAYNRAWIKSSIKTTATVIGCLCIALSTHSQAASHLTLMSSGISLQPTEINILTALKNTNLPLKKPVTQLYRLRSYKPIWSDGEKYNDNAKQLLLSIRHAHKYGLNSSEYDAEILQSFLDATSIDKALISKTDIVFSHAYIKLASHVNQGKLNKPYEIFKNDELLLSKLNNAANKNAISQAINDLKPQHNAYNNLVEALNFYKNLNEEHETLILTERSYEVGDQSAEIPKIRQRLSILGDLYTSDLTSDIYDHDLMLAVIHFQTRHGLAADGILGKRTIRELNTPIWQRIQQLELNLARAQALPDISTGKHILVNIPAYKLYLYDNHQLTYESNVVVGKKKHKTPVISSELTKIILSPYWNVPKSITRNEIIPKLKQDPDYLVKNNMRLISTVSRNGNYVDP